MDSRDNSRPASGVRGVFPALIAVAAVLAVCAAPAGAQTFGQFTTAAVSPLGEGNVFFSAGDERLDIGVTGRFQLNERSDFGVQTAYSRAEEIDSWGLGIDYKSYLIRGGSTVPVDLAGDLSYGFIRGGGFARSVFILSVMSSGMIVTGEGIDFEPYGSVGFMGQWFHDKARCGRGDSVPDSWPCEADDWETDSGLILRGGVKTWLSEEIQFCVELEYYEEVTAGGAFNVVF